MMSGKSPHHNIYCENAQFASLKMRRFPRYLVVFVFERDATPMTWKCLKISGESYIKMKCNPPIA